jgi:hypothetical protein
MWVIGGDVGALGTVLTDDVWYSYDGAHWEKATSNAEWPGRSEHASVVFDNKIWVLGGLGYYPCNDVWYSAAPAGAAHWQQY